MTATDAYPPRRKIAGASLTQKPPGLVYCDTAVPLPPEPLWLATPSPAPFDGPAWKLANRLTENSLPASQRAVYPSPYTSFPQNDRGNETGKQSLFKFSATIARHKARSSDWRAFRSCRFQIHGVYTFPYPPLPCLTHAHGGTHTVEQGCHFPQPTNWLGVCSQRLGVHVTHCLWRTFLRLRQSHHRGSQPPDKDYQPRQRSSVGGHVTQDLFLHNRKIEILWGTAFLCLSPRTPRGWTVLTQAVERGFSSFSIAALIITHQHPRKEWAKPIN